MVELRSTKIHTKRFWCHNFTLQFELVGRKKMDFEIFFKPGANPTTFKFTATTPAL
jgi:hypothetical protein